MNPRIFMATWCAQGSIEDIAGTSSCNFNVSRNLCHPLMLTCIGTKQTEQTKWQYARNCEYMSSKVEYRFSATSECGPGIARKAEYNPS